MSAHRHRGPHSGPPVGSRRLVVRVGLFSPSLDGGMALLLLSSPSRGSSSPTPATSAVFCANSAALTDCNATITASKRPISVGGVELSTNGVTDTLTQPTVTAQSVFPSYLGSYHFQ